MKITGKIRTGLKILGWIAGIWLLILFAGRIVMTPEVLQRLIDRYASEYVDGTVSIGKVKLSTFRHFPNIGITINGFEITYPAERYDQAEMEGVQGHLQTAGTGEIADTLASFRRFTGRINIASLLAGKINISFAELDKPRIFAHVYSDGQANWDIIDIPSDTLDEDTSPLPEIRLGKIRMTGHPHIVYSDSRDTVFAMADLKSMTLNGTFNTEKISRNRVGLILDSLFVAGRVSADTLAFGLDHLRIIDRNGEMELNAKAKTLLATRTFGRMNIPMELSTSFSFPERDFPAIEVTGLKAEVASIPFSGNGEVMLKEGRTGMKGTFAITDCKAEDVIDDFLKKHIPATEDIHTDASFSIILECSGDYVHSTGQLPEIKATIKVPESDIRHKKMSDNVTFSIDASATTTSEGSISASLDKIAVKCEGLDFSASGNIPDIMEEDFTVTVDGEFKADLAKLMAFVPTGTGISASGVIGAHLSGSVKPSQLNIYQFSHSSLQGNIDADTISFSMPGDSIDVNIDGLSVDIGPETRTSRIDSSRTFNLLAFKGDIGKADITYGTIAAKGDRIKISAMNSASADTNAVGILGGRFSAAGMTLSDADGMEIELRGTENGFQMLPKKDRPELPILTINSTNDKILLKDGINRIILTDAKVGGRAAMNTVERRQRARMYLDSLAKVYPEVRRDSLLAHAASMRKTRELPEWMREEDFRKSDIDIKLDETLAKYFREWDMNGRIDVRTGILMTPYFPIRNILRGMEVTFDNNTVGIDSLKIRSGESEIMAKGKLSGLKRALLGRGIINLDLDINSDKVNAGELLAAYSIGSRYTTPHDNKDISDASDAEFFKMVTTDSLAVNDSVTPLIVIPSNLNAEIRVNASDINYSELNISKMHSKLMMKERCVQITETEAISNVGDIDFEGFYATRSKEDIKAGFSFNFKDITAEKVIDLLPAVDTLMPLLKSFQGNLNCELAATASIDTCMNIILPSINGILRIGGNDLYVKDSDIFMDIARKLKFKNRQEGHIEQMSVEGVISDSVIEIFPFIAELDRYTLAMSGIHNMDESFRYHISVLRSPILIRLGIDVFGDNFDKMKFRIGKAKYKNTNVPAFSSVIDTTKINLVNSIRGIFDKGVEAAINENENNETLENYKDKIGYIRVVDQELEELSEAEKQQIEEAGSQGNESTDKTLQK